RVESDATDVERGLGGFVEGQLEVVAKQQVDTVEGRILGGGRDLRDDAVVLVHQAGANGLRSRIGDWRTRGAAGRSDKGCRISAADRDVIRGCGCSRCQRLACIVVGGGQRDGAVAGQ